jgi:hypothetical protein
MQSGDQPNPSIDNTDRRIDWLGAKIETLNRHIEILVEQEVGIKTKLDALDIISISFSDFSNDEERKTDLRNKSNQYVKLYINYNDIKIEDERRQLREDRRQLQHRMNKLEDERRQLQDERRQLQDRPPEQSKSVVLLKI